ncbi:MAG: DUF1643 domain-containing protein [Myxococcaceae bacterium]|nr:MAG: DUF1643 domain-containing protein [Myxococcaceae bacterium]
MRAKPSAVAGAVLSGKRQEYRYALWRTWNTEREPLLFIMLNPSTADAEADDPTIRRCVGFGASLGFGSVRVVNLFAWRATEPAEMMRAKDPIGPLNDGFIRDESKDVRAKGGIVVAAWGQLKRFPQACPDREKFNARNTHVFSMLDRQGIPVHCLGLTKDGHPRHPLMLESSSQLRLFRIHTAGGQPSNS